MCFLPVPYLSRRRIHKLECLLWMILSWGLREEFTRLSQRIHLVVMEIFYFRILKAKIALYWTMLYVTPIYMYVKKCYILDIKIPKIIFLLSSINISFSIYEWLHKISIFRFQSTFSGYLCHLYNKLRHLFDKNFTKLFRILH